MIWAVRDSRAGERGWQAAARGVQYDALRISDEAQCLRSTWAEMSERTTAQGSVRAGVCSPVGGSSDEVPNGARQSGRRPRERAFTRCRRIFSTKGGQCPSRSSRMPRRGACSGAAWTPAGACAPRERTEKEKAVSVSHADGCATLQSKWKTPRGARTIERVDDGKDMRSAEEWPGVPRHGVGKDISERDG